MQISFKDKSPTIKTLFQKKILKIFLLGVISGFPWVLIGSSLSLWLKEDGLSRSSIGWAGLIFAVYAFNFLWAPLVDKIQIPWLSKKIGHRKSWIFLMQIVICICLFSWSLMNPTEHLFFIIFFGLLIALCSCTQDISIDALRIEQVNEGENQLIAAGASVAVIGWWTGFKLGGLLSLSISDYFSKIGIDNYWQITFILIIFLILLFNLFLLKIEENSHRSKEEYKKFEKYFKKNISNSIIFKKYFTWLASTILTPIISFFKKNGLSISIYLILFILLFKVGEAFLGRMSVIFYKEIGFSKTDIAIFSKGIGWITTISFTLLGGILTIKMGIIKAIFISGVFMALTNLFFSILFWYDQSYLLFIISIVLDDIAAAFATVAFVTFISALVDRNFTATQYALLASIGTIGRTILASSSGSLVDYLNGNWGIFFVLTTIMVFPSLLILILIRNKIKSL